MRHRASTPCGLLLIGFLCAAALGLSGTDRLEAGAETGQPKAKAKAKGKGKSKALKELERLNSGPGVTVKQTLLEKQIFGKPAGVLSQTGFYSDFAGRKIDESQFLEYDPNYHLWSDGNQKRRFIYMPEGTQIDTSNMNQWKFPKGTMLVKEFKNPAGTQYLEHRVTVIRPSGDVFLGSYVWNAGQTEATLNTKGVTDLNGTTWDVPSQTDCHSCHVGEPSKVLGISAIQVRPTLLRALVTRNRLSHPPKSEASLALPGNAVARRALGYLHANCGHCHNPTHGIAKSIDQNLRLNVGAKRVEDTPTYKTAVNQKLAMWDGSVGGRGFNYRIYPGEVELSGLLFRMNRRGNADMMPEIGSAIVDQSGSAAVQEWIQSMPKSGDPETATRVRSGLETAAEDASAGACVPVINEIQMRAKEKKASREFVELFNPCGRDIKFDANWTLQLTDDSVESAAGAARATVLKQLAGLSIGAKKYLVITGANFKFKTKSGEAPTFDARTLTGKWLNSPAATVSLNNGLTSVDLVSWGTPDYKHTRRNAVIPPTPGRSLARHWTKNKTGKTSGDFLPQPPTPGKANITKSKATPKSKP